VIFEALHRRDIVHTGLVAHTPFLAVFSTLSETIAEFLYSPFLEATYVNKRQLEPNPAVYLGQIWFDVPLISGTVVFYDSARLQVALPFEQS
jgi:hypothetical protein